MTCASFAGSRTARGCSRNRVNPSHSYGRVSSGAVSNAEGATISPRAATSIGSSTAVRLFHKAPAPATRPERSSIMRATEAAWSPSFDPCREIGTMNPGEIYAKTDEGVRELKERQRNLPIALRSLLIMVDGNRTVGEVLQRARALRVDFTAFAALERAGLITKRFSAPSATESDAAPA